MEIFDFFIFLYEFNFAMCKKIIMAEVTIIY